MSWEQDREKQLAFDGLLRRTVDGLENVGTPGGLAALIDEVVPEWERFDKDFAALLNNIKGQAWSMSAEHVRAVRDKIRGHLMSRGR